LYVFLGNVLPSFDTITGSEASAEDHSLGSLVQKLAIRYRRQVIDVTQQQEALPLLEGKGSSRHKINIVHY
jgi:hypothetical protein